MHFSEMATKKIQKKMSMSCAPFFQKFSMPQVLFPEVNWSDNISNMILSSVVLAVNNNNSVLLESKWRNGKFKIEMLVKEH
ncbi:unnamed protein product [Ceratitis capitata]|uniref:(Mediterranean fruit fly) hypothetical protein n=1 Tax=Ceratitis capitata TaxID=7213 RepID=A0A811U4U4_CERCA|nr:unnamed protein product [Ceratitis capitata]